MEVVKAMLHDKKLPKFLWGEVANTIVFVQNRSPHRALNNKTPEQVFIDEKPKVGHLRIFGYLVTLNIEFSRDVTFDEDAALGKARDNPLPLANVDSQDDAFEILQNPKPKIDLVDEPMEPMDPPSCDPLAKRRPLLLHDTLQDVDKHVASGRNFIESKKPCRLQGYVITMSNIIQAKPYTFEEVVKAQVWKDAMAEEYESIIHNYVWEVVPRPQIKFVPSSKWLYKIKHGVDCSIEKYKARFVVKGFF
eukprot:PITA_02646